MAEAPPVLSSVLQAAYEDPSHFQDLSEDEFFDLDFADVEAIQLEHTKRRFAELRTKVQLLDRLAEDIGIDAITSWDDLAALAFPHTMFKSYRVADVEQGRFDKLTRWLSTLTAHDLSGVDVSGCISLDDWVERIETATPLRLVTSSGTSGKISILPRDTHDEKSWSRSVITFLSPSRDTPSIDFASGNAPVICPWPFDRGHQSVFMTLRVLRNHLYDGADAPIVTQQRGTMLIEEQWLMGKMARAEANGEPLQLTDRERAVVESAGNRRQDAALLMTAFAERAVEDYRDQPVAVMAGWPQLHAFVLKCQELGIEPGWAPGSIFFVGGGNKGAVMPDDWRETVEAMLPSSRYVYREMYGMTESTVVTPKCSAGHLHPYPWGVYLLVDPDNGQLLPRKGVQTGRVLMFDLLPRSYWTALLTGDEATIHWDGGCPCGRKGPYFENEIRRLSEKRGGDDKISCVRSTDAYDRLAASASTGI